MMTRRTAVRAGLAFASVATATGLAASTANAAQIPGAHLIDALLIDESIVMPRTLAAFIAASRRAMPVFAIQLDAAAYTALKPVLRTSRGIIGISSGATLFCLERIAWDHGFRLTQRSQWCADDLVCPQQAAALLNQPATTSAAPQVRAYRPSRADQTLHAWTMQKTASSSLRQEA